MELLESINFKPLKNDFNLKTATETINKELNLIGKNLIGETTLAYWRRIGIIQFDISKKNIKLNRDQVEKIKQVAFYRIILGVELKKIPNTIEYFSNIKTLIKNL